MDNIMRVWKADRTYKCCKCEKTIAKGTFYVEKWHTFTAVECGYDWKENRYCKLCGREVMVNDLRDNVASFQGEMKLQKDYFKVLGIEWEEKLWTQEMIDRIHKEGEKLYKQYGGDKGKK